MRFIESILLKDGVYYNLELHQERLDRTFSEFMPGIEPHDLQHILPKLKFEGTFKVRVVYDADSEDADYDLEFAEYIPRKIHTLQVVKTASLDYQFKFENRKRINELINLDEADDIIIALGDRITDSSYANLAFWNGSKWLTPDTPLLKGVRRTQLLLEGKIKEIPILITDLHTFEKVSLINAMLNLGDLVLPTSAISLPKNDD